MTMDRLAELDRFHLDPALRAWLASTFEAMEAQSKQDASAIATRDLKIQALTLELAHLRRWGCKPKPSKILKVF